MCFVCLGQVAVMLFTCAVPLRMCSPSLYRRARLSTIHLSTGTPVHPCQAFACMRMGMSLE